MKKKTQSVDVLEMIRNAKGMTEEAFIDCLQSAACLSVAAVVNAKDEESQIKAFDNVMRINALLSIFNQIDSYFVDQDLRSHWLKVALYEEKRLSKE